MGKPGGAFLDMKTSLDYERVVFAGLGMGVMKFCLHASAKYAATRKQFDQPLMNFQLIQEKIADMSASLDMVSKYCYQTCQDLMDGKNVNKEAAIAKYLGAKLTNDVAREAVQIMGGYGYMQEYQVERCMRDAKLFEIGGGTSEIQKMIIAKQTFKELEKAYGFAPK